MMGNCADSGGSFCRYGARLPTVSGLWPVLSLLVASCGEDVLEPETGPPATLDFITPLAQTAFVDNVAVAGPVRVLDAEGRPVVGAQVRFRAEGGDLARAVQYTDRNGDALVGWRLGPTPGPQRLFVEVGDLATTTAIEAVQPPPPAFTISLHYVRSDGLFDQDKLAIVRAAIRWEEMVLGDLPDVRMPDALPSGCPDVPAALRGASIDDLIVLIIAGTLQGTAARTTICARRPGGGLPYVVTIRLDPAKATALDGIRATMAHEIGHALGIGTLWGARLVDYNGDLRFSGPYATAAWQLIGGAQSFGGYPGVPVHSEDGDGIAWVHWSERVFGTELLTPFANRGVAEPISVISAASLRDLGYVIDDSKADPFRFEGAPPVSPRPASPRDRPDPRAWPGSTPRTAPRHPASR